MQRRTQGGAVLNGGDSLPPNHSSHLPSRSSRPRVSQQRADWLPPPPPPFSNRRFAAAAVFRRRHFPPSGSGAVSSGFPLLLVPQPESSPWKPSPWARSPLGGEGVGSVLGPAPAARPRRTAPPVGPRPAAGRSRHPSPSFCQGLRPVLLPGCARTVKRGFPLVFL